MAVVEETNPERKSLEDVHGSIAIPPSTGRWHKLRRLFTFLGPAYLVSVGYMDPGNWATDLEGGARFGYALIWVLLMSNVMAIFLQTLSARLGVVTGHDLAQACRAEYSPRMNLILWLLAEVAIAACDLAEVLGTIIGLKLLFGLPLLWGCLITAFDTFALLYLQRWGMADGGRHPGDGRHDGRLLPGPDLSGPARLLGGGLGPAAEPATGRAVRGDRHPRGDGDAPQSLPSLGARADAPDRHRQRQPGFGVQVFPHRLRDCPQRRLFRQCGDPGPECRSLSPARSRGCDDPGSAQAAPLVPGQGGSDPLRRRPALRRTEFNPDRDAGRANRDGGISPHPDRSLAATAGHAADRTDSRGGRDRPGWGAIDAAASGSQSGDPELAAFVRCDSAHPLHVEPPEHGGVCHPLVGAGPGLGSGRGDRGPQRQARL